MLPLATHLAAPFLVPLLLLLSVCARSPCPQPAADPLGSAIPPSASQPRVCQVLPTNTNQIAWSNQLSVQLENGTGFRYDPFSPVPDWVMRDQRHAYYASTSCE